MNAFTCYKRNPADFLDGVASMPLELIGAYSVLLNTIYLLDRPLRDDDAYLAGLLRVHPRKWRPIRAKLLELGKITAVDGRVDNPWARSERATRASQSRVRATAGRMGGERSGERRRNNALAKALASAKTKQMKKEREDAEGVVSSPSFPVGRLGFRLFPEEHRDRWTSWNRYFQAKFTKDRNALAPPNCDGETCVSMLTLMKSRQKTGRPIRVASEWPPMEDATCPSPP